MFARIAHWTFIVFLSLVGLYLTLLGGFLVYKGGSLYYVTAGIATLVVAIMMVRRNVLAPRVYGGIIAVTIVWALFESDLYLLALLPRLAMWIGLALWFLTPWYQATLKARYGAEVPATKPWFVIPGLAALAVLLIAAGQGYTQNGTGTVRPIAEATATGDWRHYGNTAGGTRFAEIDQINTETVAKLKEVWRYRTGVEDDFKMTPLQVNGLLYICGARNILIAVDSDSGEEVWRHDPQAKPPGTHQYARTCRGISYHEAPADYTGQCPKRIVTGTIDARLIAVDAMTGERCSDFGAGGAVNLRKGMGEHNANQYYVTSPPLVADDVLVVGGLVLDSQDLGMPSGVVRAFDALTGSFVWAWDLGNPGEYGEPGPGEEYTRGTPNVWSVMSYDAELDLIYAPTGNAPPDYYGGERRPLDDEWSSSVVAIDAATGEPRWKYQTVHHDIWDYDVPAQPVLVDVERDGERVPSVAVPTKMGAIFLLDRRDGTPVYPIEERAAPQDPAVGDYLAPTQPFSPLPNFHPYLHEKDMWGLTPLDQLLCRVEYKLLRYEGLFTPPTPAGSLQFPANFGGFNWGSVSVDADNGLLVAAPMLLANRLMLVTPEQVAAAGPRAAMLLGADHPAVRMDPDAPVPPARDPDPNDPYDHVRIRYYGLTLPFMSRFGTQVPCFEPPWSQIAVIDLNTNELLWRRPVGSMKDSGPFGLRSGLPFQVGVAIRAGTLTTRGGLTFIASTMDRTVRAFDLRTGAVKWSAELPGSGQATPMTYLSEATGRQHLIVTVPNPSWRYPRDPSTGTYTDSRSVRDGKGGYVIAYALESE
ncbi:PQQ-binding-like beta-propeller repeat protein [Exilibacterium tricleocarpae]|uniref:PQQ-binding-like beta-propeller repeat protein n=2 Tax=Exilibacterium tricleocarpae TaxID=2591008 RepID=A0A545SRW6_9GAMM|nr:PQQ-binding-like beta-propeller repeat protein [Exilibacterium tricleocarpae]